MVAMTHPQATWPPELSSIGALRFARRSAHFDETVRFYRDLVGLPLCATFEESFGSSGAIFGLPRSTLTFEIVEAAEPGRGRQSRAAVPLFPRRRRSAAGDGRLAASGVEPVESIHWAATGAVTYRDPDGREVVFAPFVFGVNEPAEGASSGEH